MMGPGQAPTRSAVLELKQERAVVSEAYDFLDEKRLLLASELLRQLTQYERLLDDIEVLNQDARQRLAGAVQWLGLQGLSVYPAATLEASEVRSQQRNFMGVILVETELVVPATENATASVSLYPSADAESCRMVFRQIIEKGALLSGISGNMYRLLKEYRLTERRARALENVILPEIEQSLGYMNTHLEELELEDAIRARLQKRRSDGQKRN